MCSIKSSIASFYDIVHLWAIDWVLFLDNTHANLCTTNIYLTCGLVLIFLCVFLTISLWRYRLSITDSRFRQKSVHLSLANIFTFNTAVVTEE